MTLRIARTPSSRGAADGRLGPLVSRRSLLFLGAAGLASIPLAGATPSTGSGSGLALAGDEDDVLDARDFGAKGNGSTDDTRALQRLLDSSARRGAVAFVPAGTYRCTTGLLLRSDVQLQLDRRARLVKDWAAPPGMIDAFLRNADFAVKSNRVRITGEGSIGAADHSRTGVVLALYGDDVEVSGITVDTYAGGQAVMYGGDRGRITGITVRNSAAETGTGGIRVIGGEDFLGTGCHVESGDDCFQFVPIGNPEAEPTLYNRTISGGSFVGCTGVSSVSRFLVALLEYTGGDPGTTDMDASVVDCSFVDCHGAAANRGIVVKNTHSRGAIERVAFTDCTVDMASAPDASTQEIRVQTDPASRGAIRDVTFTRTDVLNPRNSTLRAGGPNISGLTFDGCTLTAPSGAAPMMVVVDGTDRARFTDCTFVGAAGKRHLVAGPTTAVTELSVENCRFTGIDGAWAVDVLNGAGVRIAGSTFQPAAGSTTARAIRTSPTTSGVVIEGNDFTGITNPTPITDRAVGTTLSSNRGL
ncbi:MULTISPECIES: glycosyl hydrolase family 28-related protein [unclassified Blastococcus]